MDSAEEDPPPRDSGVSSEATPLSPEIPDEPAPEGDEPSARTSQTAEILAAELLLSTEEGRALPRATSTPILASEALMEDLAPMEPARHEARVLCGVVGALSVVFGVVPLTQWIPGGLRAALPLFVTGAIAVVAGATKVTYRLRAIAMMVLGVLGAVVALEANGGALFLADGGRIWGWVRLVPVIALTAALLFRARYRAFRGARIFLGIALALAVPFVVHTLLRFWSGGSIAPQLGAVAALLALAGSLTGFMGAETEGSGPYLSPIVVAAFSIDVGLRACFLEPRTFASILATGLSTMGLAGAATLTAFGLFQLLAWRYAADARCIDLHAPRRDNDDQRESHRSDWVA